MSSTPLKSKNEKYKQRNSTPFHSPVNTSPANKPKDTLIPGKEPIDAFIDNLIEGEESIIQDVNKVLPTSLLLQREFETRDLPAINLMRFDGYSKQWSNFIQNFKHRVHNKISFSDSVRMDRLLSVLDGEAKRAVSVIGQDGLFYASALKLLKRQFGNPLMVSYLKLMEVLELPPIQHDDQNSLRNYHQKLKTIVTWLKTMGYDGALKSVENVTKAVMRLPKYLRQKFYRNFKIINYNEREMNLEIFENWLGERIYDMNNPLALIIETEIKRKQQANKDYQKTTKDKHQRFPKDHCNSSDITTDMEEDRNAESKTRNGKTQRAVLQLSIEYPSN